jgi:hypothetical protein
MAVQFSQADADVLVRIVNGERAFGDGASAAALKTLEGHGFISVELVEKTVERVKRYEFGRHWTVVREPSAYLLVKASKIERAIEKHGKAALLASIQAGVSEEPARSPRSR